MHVQSVTDLHASAKCKHACNAGNRSKRNAARERTFCCGPKKTLCSVNFCCIARVHDAAFELALEAVAVAPPPIAIYDPAKA